MSEDRLTADHPMICEFLAGWHEAGRAEFERRCPSLDYDSYYAKTAHERRKYIALDEGSTDGVHRSGVYLVDRATGEVWTIKGYGVPNRRLGTVTDVIAARGWAR